GIAGVAAVANAHATSFTFTPVLLVAGIGMGAIFAPAASMAMQAAPDRLAGAASGVLNTGRQLGGVLGGAVTGAVLAGQLASSLGISGAADLQVGRGQSAIGHGVFVHAYITAMRPTLAVSVGVLLVAAFLCLILRRRIAPAPVKSQMATTEEP